MFVLNKSEAWNIHAELSKVLIFLKNILFFPPFFFASIDLTFFSINYHAQEVSRESSSHQAESSWQGSMAQLHQSSIGLWCGVKTER